MNTILIDFKNTSDKELKLIASKFGIKLDYLIELREETFVEKVLMDLVQKKVLAYKYSNIDGFFYNDDVFETIKPYKVEVPKDVVFDVDTILDKIKDYGIDFISIEEKAFLDNLSK